MIWLKQKRNNIFKHLKWTALKLIELGIFQLSLIAAKRGNVKNSSYVTNVGNEVIAWVLGAGYLRLVFVGRWGGLRDQNQAKKRHSSDTLNRRRLNCVIRCRNGRDSERKFMDYRISSKPEEMFRKHVRSVRILCFLYRTYSYNKYINQLMYLIKYNTCHEFYELYFIVLF